MTTCYIYEVISLIGEIFWFVPCPDVRAEVIDMLSLDREQADMVIVLPAMMVGETAMVSDGSIYEPS